ncbi:MAG: class I SAM-dependent methyltransferase, partial [Dokdonella sp.]
MKFFNRKVTGDAAAELVAGGRVSGWIDVARFDGDEVEIKGWLLHPTLPINSVEVALDGHVIARVPVQKLPNVAAHYPTVEHAEESGFSTSTPAPPTGALVTITARGFRGNQPVGYYQSFALRGPEAARLAPSAALMKRVSGTESPTSFAQMGICAAGDLMQAADQHLGVENVKSLLDFGCGSGRVGNFLLSLWPDIAYSGCDIDAEAVAWCNQNLREGAFKPMDMQPPLPYPDASFDVVVAVSVMTHLTRAEQHKWLAEVRRVIRPGGLFLPSIHGAFA